MMAQLSLEADKIEMVVYRHHPGDRLGHGLRAALDHRLLDARPRAAQRGAAVFALVRNIGSSVGISLAAGDDAAQRGDVQSRLGEGVRPDNPVLVLALPEFDFTMPGAVAGMHGEIARQAMMVSYIDASG